jgi:ectoine hydroxylase-related dioxygenase (phytanoyl-CoA dioxygenase family)
MFLFQFQLADVNEGDGGLCVIPGSHKANFPSSVKLREWEEDRNLVYNVPCKAGDLVIFNEATMHGTLPWVADHERRALLVRYSPKYLHFAGGFYDPTFPEWVNELTEAQRSVLEPPYIYNRPLIEDDGETVVRPRRE